MPHILEFKSVSSLVRSTTWWLVKVAMTIKVLLGFLILKMTMIPRNLLSIDMMVECHDHLFQIETIIVQNRWLIVSGKMTQPKQDLKSRDDL